MRLSTYASLLVMAIIITSVFVHCSDDRATDPAKQMHYPTVAHGPINSSNPMDSVGIDHNEYLEYYESYVRDIDTTSSQILARLELALENLDDSLNWADGELEALIDSIEAYANRQDSTETAIDQMMNCSAGDNITQREADYIHDIAEAFNTATDSASLMSMFSHIEQDMANENWDDGEDCALAVIAVAKHSFCSSLLWDWDLERAIYTAAEDANAEFWSPWPKDHRKTKTRVSVHSYNAACWWKPGMEVNFPNY